MTPARYTPTVTLDGERIVCRTAEGAVSDLPLPAADLTMIGAWDAANAVARDRWHAGVWLARKRARVVRGGAVEVPVVQLCMGCGVQEAPAGCRCASCSTPPTAEERAWLERMTAGVAS